MPAEKDTALGRLAVERGYVTQPQLDEALALQHKMHDDFGMDQPLEQILVGKHLLSQDQAQELRHAVAIQTGEARLVAGYEVISKLGQGGMGAVYKAKHPTSGQFVALKILPPSLATDELVKRFRREAEVVRKLDHANIVACTEFGFDKRRKVHFCALELIEGEDLAKRITRVGRLSEDEALSITNQIAMALQHAFYNGLVHRDVKPENIMVTADGTAKLLDLGLARPANQEATRLTESGMFVGSPYYASPEQALGQREVDTRSDIYSLGATLYHMVTGKPPFEGTTALAILQKHVNEKLPWPGDVNPDLSDGLCMIIAKMMEKSPEDRYDTPNELNRDLDLLMEGDEPEAGDAALKNSSVKVPAVRPGRRRPAARERGAKERDRRHREPAERRRRDSARERRRGAEVEAGRKVSGWAALPTGAKIAAGTGVLALVVIGLVMFLGGGKPDRKPPKPGRRQAAARTSSAAKGEPLPKAEPPRPRTKLLPDAEPPATLTLDLGGGVKMEFVYVKPGTFVMGGENTTERRFHAVETPKHTVTITKGFYLGKYEVTQAQFQTIMGRNPSRSTRIPNCPVDSAEWYDEIAFCRKVAEQTGREVRLPTEAEWEYACRAGTDTDWSHGSDPAKLVEYAWTADNAGGRSHPVGQKKPNPRGLYDMHGNVCERVADMYHRDYYASSPKEDPTGANVGYACGEDGTTILRGGTWKEGADGCRSGKRLRGGGYGYYDNWGFRAAVSASAPGPKPSKRPTNVPADAVGFGGHWYKLYKQRMTWHDAEVYCEKQGGHLVTLASANEHRFVASMGDPNSRHGPWIGMFRNDRNAPWRWVTGEPLAYVAWSEGQPSGDGNAVEIFIGFAWNDYPEKRAQQFLCEWEPGALKKAPAAAGIDLTRGLVGHWKFDESKGTTARDSSGKGNHGKIVGAGYGDGRVEGALRLDGRDDYVQVAVEAHGRFTVSTWFDMHSRGNLHCPRLIETPYFFIFIHPADTKIQFETACGGSWRAFVSVVGSGWRHIAVVYDGTSIVNDPMIYLNGVALPVVEDAAPYRTLAPIAGTANIGNRPPAHDRSFPGRIDDVRIYNRALSAEEVTALCHEPERVAAEQAATSAREKAQAGLDSLLTEFDSLMVKGGYAAAREWAKKAAGAPENVGAKEVFEAAEGVAEALADRPAAIRRGAESLVGKEVKLRLKTGTMSGKIKEVRDDHLVIATTFTINRQTRERLQKVAWSALHPDQKADFAARGGWKVEAAERAVARAYAALASGDLDAAESAARETGGHPLAEHLKARVAKVKVQAVYAGAMNRAKARMRVRNWKGAVESLEEALAVKPEDAEAKKLLAEAESHIGPAPTVTLDLGGGVTMEFIYVKPGVFIMGGTKDIDPNSRWGGIERPKHEVAITRGFYIGKYEVTQAQYEVVMGSNPSKWKEPDRPVEQMTWRNAVEFCRLATERTRRQVRLPAEAEWEYACRAGTTTRFSFGDNEGDLGEHAWYKSNSGGQTHPVGQKKPNAWGLYDMHGNVWEWVADWYAPDYYAKTPREDPTGPGTGDRRVLRGGTLSDNGGGCRSAARTQEDGRLLFHYGYRLGFRAAMSVSPGVSASAGEVYDRAVARAKMRIRLGNWKGAAEACEEALKLKPGDAEAKKLLAEAESHIGPPKTLTLDLGGGVTMEFVHIKPGAFMMGGNEDPKHGWQGVEKPKHEVAITRGFYMGRYEVTRGQFAAFVKATGYRTEAEKEGKSWGRRTDGRWGDIPGANWRDPLVFAQTNDHPVMCVSWNDVKAFCEWAAAKTRSAVRLPTEAEWEYAARAGSTTRYCFGDSEGGLGQYAWHDKNANWQTHPVGQKKANAWGLYDVHGNVWEWVADWYAADYYTKSPRENSAGPDAGARRLLRGGSWCDNGYGCRSAFRLLKSPSYRFTYKGFRACVSPSPRGR